MNRRLTLSLLPLLFTLAACAQPPTAVPPTAGTPPTAGPLPTATATLAPTATPTPTPTPAAHANRDADRLPPSPTPTPEHPLMIDVMRRQPYPGSELTIESRLDPGENYDRYIAVL